MEGCCDAFAVPCINCAAAISIVFIDNDYHLRLKWGFALSEFITEVVSGQIIDARPN
tara:strand:+ start:182 stop:352 length:171 start_codon:yes stop_codon:yes gene_type:complete